MEAHLGPKARLLGHFFYPSFQPLIDPESGRKIRVCSNLHLDLDPPCRVFSSTSAGDRSVLCDPEARAPRTVFRAHTVRQATVEPVAPPRVPLKEKDKLKFVKICEKIETQRNKQKLENKKE